MNELTDDEAYKKLMVLEHEYNKKLAEVAKRERNQSGSIFLMKQITGKNVTIDYEGQRKSLENEYKQKAMETAQPYIDTVKFEEIAQKHASEQDLQNPITISQSKLIEQKVENQKKEQLKNQEAKAQEQHTINQEREKQSEFEVSIQEQIKESEQNPSQLLTGEEFLDMLEKDKTGNTEQKTKELTKEEQKAQLVEQMKKQWGMNKEVVQKLQQLAKSENGEEKQSKEAQREREVEKLQQQWAQNKELTKGKEP